MVGPSPVVCFRLPRVLDRRVSLAVATTGSVGPRPHVSGQSLHRFQRAVLAPIRGRALPLAIRPLREAGESLGAEVRHMRGLEALCLPRGQSTKTASRHDAHSCHTQGRKLMSTFATTEGLRRALRRACCTQVRAFQRSIREQWSLGDPCGHRHFSSCCMRKQVCWPRETRLPARLAAGL